MFNVTTPQQYHSPVALLHRSSLIPLRVDTGNLDGWDITGAKVKTRTLPLVCEQRKVSWFWHPHLHSILAGYSRCHQCANNLTCQEKLNTHLQDNNSVYTKINGYVHSSGKVWSTLFPTPYNNKHQGYQTPRRQHTQHQATLFSGLWHAMATVT